MMIALALSLALTVVAGIAMAIYGGIYVEHDRAPGALLWLAFIVLCAAGICGGVAADKASKQSTCTAEKSP